MSISRKELVSKYKIAIKKVNELKSKKYNYKTNRTCEPFGLAKNMSIEDVVKAGASIHDADANIDACMKLYGVSADEIKTGENRKYLGFSISDWDADFKLRVEQIHNEAKLKKYEAAAEKLEKNFSEDDRFLIEMGEIDELDVDLDDSEESQSDTDDQK